MHEFNLFSIPMIPYFLIFGLILWSLWKKDKWINSAFLALSFASAPLFFVFVGEEASRVGNFQVGFEIGKYASVVATVPFAVFGWYLGKKLSARMALLLAIVGVVLNLAVVKAYQSLIKKNAEILSKEVKFDCQKLPYHCAIKENRLDDIAIYKSEGHDINARDFSSRSALWYGIENEKAVQTLLDHGADPDSFNIYGETPLAFTLVISLKPNLKIAEMLIKNGAQINRTVGFRKKISILNFAVVNDNYDAINFALENGADPNFSDGYRKTPCQRLIKMPADKIRNLVKYCPEK